jgi:hypothetical protein
MNAIILKFIWINSLLYWKNPKVKWSIHYLKQPCVYRRSVVFFWICSSDNERISKWCIFIFCEICFKTLKGSMHVFLHKSATFISWNCSPFGNTLVYISFCWVYVWSMFGYLQYHLVSLMARMNKTYGFTHGFKIERI